MLSLPPDNQAYINQLVETGVYTTTDNVLDEAVALLRERDSIREKVLAGQAQADAGQLIPGEEVFARLEARAREIEKLAAQ
ncbi:ribbon-helix-helix domain-containing protein [Adhaeretor mobilis]|uniref:Type II toxin-antitoxin system ParD family antitoxin n=1 Tax=Adhaeretor mobilis TaxID=1930276 RepID=A0A517MR44_9BACT|nr:type II toxin-antitoxin system ParD family antitoxin [Adhaeretor mobilis]QDS97351.1 hypothetical protein HG15A2_06120 [Adhaeretor mobilis]